MSSPAPRILVAEDDEVIRTAVTEALVGAGYRVDATADGDSAVAAAGRSRPDLAVLDVMLPGRSGFDVARALRAGADIPVMFLTARDAVADRLTGFAAGADDYLVKPFALAELLARVRAVLRRSGWSGDRALAVDDLVVDEDSATVRRGGEDIALTATELRLLVYLVRNRDRVMSKTQILTQVWGYDAYDPNLVEAFVSGLRRKLEEHGPRLIHTVRGLGYRVSAPSASVSGPARRVAR